jgi:hypothetical protein
MNNIVPQNLMLQVKTPAAVAKFNHHYGQQASLAANPLFAFVVMFNIAEL